jgi:arylsulfatase A-like enzyme
MTRIDRRGFIAGAALASLSAPAIARHRKGHLPPNIVLMTADDLFDVERGKVRFGVDFPTPGFDLLAANAATFTHAYASTAVCEPSRTAIVSGMNPLKTGVHVNDMPWWDFVNPMACVPGILKERRGYHVYSFGKVTHGRGTIWKDTGIAKIEFNPIPRDDRAVVARVLDELPGFREPWLLMLGLSNPHSPFESPEQFYEGMPLSDVEPLNWRGDIPPAVIAEAQRQAWRELELSGRATEEIWHYLANVRECDFYTRRVIRTLLDLTPQPHILFTGDHGYQLGEVDATKKLTLWEAAIVTPFYISTPTSGRGVIMPNVISLLDVAPTLLEWAGMPKPDRMDGESRAAAANDPSMRWNGKALTSMISRGEGVPNVMNFSLRTEDWRISRYPEALPEYIELFEASDLLNRRNLANEDGYRAIRNDMLERLDREVERWRS